MTDDRLERDLRRVATLLDDATTATDDRAADRRPTRSGDRVDRRRWLVAAAIVVLAAVGVAAAALVEGDDPGVDVALAPTLVDGGPSVDPVLLSWPEGWVTELRELALIRGPVRLDAGSGCYLLDGTAVRGASGEVEPGTSGIVWPSGTTVGNDGTVVLSDGTVVASGSIVEGSGGSATYPNVPQLAGVGVDIDVPEPCWGSAGSLAVFNANEAITVTDAPASRTTVPPTTVPELADGWMPIGENDDTRPLGQLYLRDVDLAIAGNGDAIRVVDADLRLVGYWVVPGAFVPIEEFDDPDFDWVAYVRSLPAYREDPDVLEAIFGPAGPPVEGGRPTIVGEPLP